MMARRPLLRTVCRPSLVSSRKVACRASSSGPWQAKQFSEKIRRMSRSKSTSLEAARPIAQTPRSVTIATSRQALSGDFSARQGSCEGRTGAPARRKKMRGKSVHPTTEISSLYDLAQTVRAPIWEQIFINNRLKCYPTSAAVSKNIQHRSGPPQDVAALLDTLTADSVVRRLSIVPGCADLVAERDLASFPSRGWCGDLERPVQDRTGRSQNGRYRRLVFHPSIKDKGGEASAWRSLRSYPIAGLCVST